MAKHDDLLEQGPREAPEPETAEEKSRKLGLKTAGGAVAGGGAVVAKAGGIGLFGKFFLWLFIWNGVSTAGRIGGWIGVALVVTLVAGAIELYRRRRRA
ncbi:MAG TPA: hypothetical protein VKR79_06790 [Gaiellaceae bacterium]|nr:hypothetical protein [Gaiellaceae bacterium]